MRLFRWWLGFRLATIRGFFGLMAVIAVLAMIDSAFGLGKHGPNVQDPYFNHNIPTWPQGSDPSAMCGDHGGVIQVMPVGGSTKSYLLSGSEVACEDGATVSVSS